MRWSAPTYEKGDSTKKRMAQESIRKTQANPVLNSEPNASRECELYRETVSERKRIYHSAGMREDIFLLATVEEPKVTS